MIVLNPMDKCVTCQRVANPNVLQYANDKRNNGLFNDVIIEAGDQTIAANRMILSCCSRFFEAMFDLEMKEKYQNPVQIHGVDGAAVKSVIDFMYSGEVKITSENVMELIAASDYLQVAEVKRFCFEFLESILSLENWFAVLSAALLYENEDLQDRVHACVSNNFDDVVQTDEFKSLPKNKLVSLISKLNKKHIKEKSIFNGVVTWCRHDKVTTQKIFPGLFKNLIDLNKFSTEELGEIVLKEDLIKENVHCLEQVTNCLCQRLKPAGETKIISLGGNNSLRSCIEVYSLSPNHQTTFPDLPITVSAHCSLKVHDSVYLIGGESISDDEEETAVPFVWRLDLNNQVLKWQEVAHLHENREIMGGAVFRDTLVVAGGHDGNDSINSVEFYVAALDEWKAATPLPEPRCAFALVATDKHLYALGGWINDECTASVQRISNLQKSWEDVAPLQMPRRWFASVICSGIIYAIGGQTDSEQDVTTNTVEKYDFAEEKWIYVSSMKAERNSHAACVMNGKIYVVGGLDSTNEAVNFIECFDPETNSWSIIGKNDSDIFNHSLIVL